jgi:hypothetical protein
VIRGGDDLKIRMLAHTALVGLAISFALPIFAQQKETVDPQLREALLALAKKFEGAWNNNDADALAAVAGAGDNRDPAQDRTGTPFRRERSLARTEAEKGLIWRNQFRINHDAGRHPRPCHQ